MKLIVWANVLVLAFLSSIAQSSNNPTNQKTPIVIDGESNDWYGYNQLTDEKSKISYIITNDQQRIYFLFRFPDKITQMKVLRSGLEINIDTLGKNNYPITIIYPYSIDRENNDEYNHSFTGIEPDMNFEDSKDRLIKNSKQLKLIGFNNGYNEVVINTINKINVKSALKFSEDNSLIYELSVPIKLFFESDIQKYKYPFNFQLIIKGLPYTSGELSDSRYFEFNTFTFKSKLSPPIQ